MLFFSVLTDNLRVTPADYDHYCITVPVDSRLPSGGNQLCGFYDVKPALFGNVDNLVRPASDFNASSVLAMNQTYGPAWQDVTQVLFGRMLRVGAQFDF